MRNLRRQLIAACMIASFGASVALACGVDFGWQLLDNRATTLDTMPLDSKSFAYAEAHLFPSPNDKLTAEETDYPDEGRNDGIAEAVAHAEVAGLASDQADVVQQMRAEASGDSAFNKGATLPAAVRLYTAGAVDFHKGDSAKAIARFQAILDLPANERRDREVWAAYMLGRLYGSKGDIAEASKSFASTRELANNGAPDPLGLGVASFGEEARLHLKRAETLQKAKKMSPQQLREYGHEIAAAVRLYAEQAAHGSTIGIDSLGRVVDDLIGDEEAVAASICDPMVQQLLVTRTLDGDASAPNNQDTSSTSRISTLVTSLQKCGPGNITAADRLAAIAYRDGDYNLAHTLASQMTTPLAMWVQARLAMQKGDVGEAAKYYAAASKAFPSSGDTDASDDRARALLVGENGVLTLSRGEYVDALEQLYPYAATFWGDVAYIAERVLTVDELKTFVDTHKDTQFHPAVSLDSQSTPSTNPDESTSSEPSDSENGSGPADQLRDLLARRLVRAGRYQEALKYFPPPAVETSTPLVPPTMIPGTGVSIIRMGQPVIPGNMGGGHGAVATGLFPLGLSQGQAIAPNAPEPQKAPENFVVDYVQALDHANIDKSNVDRARGWYRAATLAGDFKSGNQIMGTEGPPDNYGEPIFPFVGIGRFELRADDRLVTEGERQRFKASAPKPNFRYHYRFVGADEAIRAADLLPPRSQAFAAVLCHATSWMTDGVSCPASAADLRASPAAYGSETPSIVDPLTSDVRWPNGDTARINLTCQLYQRYLKEGAVVPWATKFGHDCPEPDFASAIHFVQAQEIHEARRRTQMIHHRWSVLMKLVLVALCLGASTWWFLRHRYV
jgi:cellulose synthase operon protein C